MKTAADAVESIQSEYMKKEVILEKLRQKGCRITKQRKVLIDVILDGGCTCCKEIYFMAIKKDPNIGMATIYRMVNLLEEIGALKWRNEYQIFDDQKPVTQCLVELSDASFVELDQDSFKQVLEKGMEECGYLHGQKICQVVNLPSDNFFQ